LCYYNTRKRPRAKEKEIKKMKLIQNIECGNIFPYTLEGLIEMREEARELYDIDDPTNDVSISEYYQIIEV
jgi:hypothetical protein